MLNLNCTLFLYVHTHMKHTQLHTFISLMYFVIIFLPKQAFVKNAILKIIKKKKKCTIVFLFMCLSLWAHFNQFKSKVPGGPHQYFPVWRPRWKSGVSDDGANTNRRRKRRGCGGEWRGRSAIRRPRKAEWAAVARSDESWSLLITADSFIISTYWTQGEFTNYFLWRAAVSLRACVCACPCMRACAPGESLLKWTLLVVVKMTTLIQSGWTFLPPESASRRKNQTSIPKLLTKAAIL